MSRRRRLRRPLVAMPSYQKPRGGGGGAGGEWEDDEGAAAWYGDDLIDGEALGESGQGSGNHEEGGGGDDDDDYDGCHLHSRNNHLQPRGSGRYYEADGDRGLVQNRERGGAPPSLFSSSRPGGGGGGSRHHLVRNNVAAERALQLSPAVLDFGIVQQGSLSRKRLRVRNCSTHIARARVEPFRAFHQLRGTENFFQARPNVARLSGGLSEYVTISILGRQLGPFRETLRIFVSEHDLVYEIPVVGRVLPEDGFEDALRRADLARKMRELEVDPLERTVDAEQSSGRRLIPSAELTVGWDNGLEEDAEEKKQRVATSVDNVSAIPTFPNVKWNTFANRLRTDHRTKWKIEPDTSVGVDVIKKRYEKMVSRSNSKWANIEDRFHVAKMIQKMSGLSRTGVLAAAASKINKAKKGAASIAFADHTPHTGEEQQRQIKMQQLVKKPGRAPAGANIDHGTTAGMTREKREAMDAATEKKLLGELGQLSQQSR